MSTDYDVFPLLTDDIQVGDFLEALTHHFATRCKRVGVTKVPKLFIELWFKRQKRKTYMPKDKFVIPEGHFAWLCVEGLKGGAWIDCSIMDDEEHRFWTYEIIPQPTEWWPLQDIQDCLATRVKCTFSRNMGQPGTINILYGIAAGVFADMTRGIVTSIDSAWDSKQLPAKGHELCQNHMRAQSTDNVKFKKWAVDCKALMKEELSE